MLTQARGGLHGWAWAGWSLLSIAALAIGVASLRYALPTVPSPARLPNFVVRHGWLVAHACFSSVALIVGPWQFLPMVRRRWIVAHRWMGRVYCAAVLAGWVTSIPVALHAAFGPVSSVGFFLLGLFWAGCTLAGYVTIRRGQVAAHREWMIRSYALTAAAITLRIYLPLLLLSGVAFPTTYRIDAWDCWIPNLLVAEVLVRWTRTELKTPVRGGMAVNLQ